MVSSIRARWQALQLRPQTADLVPLGALILVFMIVNLVLLPHGVFGGGDSPRYMDGGQQLAAGQPMTVTKPLSYLSFIGLTAASINLGLGFYGVVIAQLLAEVIAIAAIYSLGRSLAGRSAGLAAAAILAADTWLSVQNFVMMTEALYTSMVVISVWAVVRTADRGGWRYVIALVSVVLTAGIRPNGYLLIPIALIFLIWRKVPGIRWRWAASAVVIVVALAVAAAPSWLHNEVSAENPASALGRGITVWAYPEKPYWLVSMPDDPLLRQGDWTEALRYGFKYPLQTLWLMLARVGIHFANVRPDATLLTNLAGSIWLLWVYPLAVLGFIRFRRHPVAILALAIIVAHTVIIALTWTERHGRFLFYVLPFFYLLAAAALVRPGLPARAPGWRFAQAAGAVVVLMRLATGISPDVYTNWLPGSSYLPLAGPSPLDSTLTRVEYDRFDLLGFRPLPSTVRAGASVPLTLYWQGHSQMQFNYQASIWLADQTGARIGGTDMRIGGNFFFPGSPYGTSRWMPGLRMVDQPKIAIPSGAGTFRVYLSVLGRDKNLLVTHAIEGHPAEEGQVLLQTITVVP